MKVLAALLLISLPIAAQTPAAAIQQHLDAAKTAAGKTWMPAAEYFCSPSPTPNRPTDPAIEPVRLFDNVLAIGSVGTTVLSPSFVTLPALQQYIGSVKRCAEVAAKNKVDVELQNHPLMDGFAAKLAKLSQRGPGDPNPFVVGEKDYGAFLNVISECAEAQLLRRSN